MARDRISELLMIKQRAGKYKRVPSHADILSLKDIWEKHFKNIGPADELVPIRIVTMLEVFLRHWIEKLIDHGAPYVERASKLSQNLKYDFAIARSLQGGSVSLGQLIAHSISLSQLEPIASTFNALLDQDFFIALSKVRDRWAVELEGDAAVPIIRDISEVRKTLAKLFDARNILVHEMPKLPPHEVEDVAGFLDQSTEFVQAAEELFASLIYGQYPLTQMGMNADAAKQRESAVAELESVCVQIEGASGSDEIRNVQKLWSSFMEAEADRVTEWDLGGSIRPMIHSSTATSLIKDRIRQLTEWLDGRMD